MAVTKLGSAFDGVRGASVEFGTLTIDPASIAAGVEGAQVIALPGVKVGDHVILQADTDLEVGLVVKATKVTADDVLTVDLLNTTAAPIDGAERTYFYVAYKVVSV